MTKFFSLYSLTANNPLGLSSVEEFTMYSYVISKHNGYSCYWSIFLYFILTGAQYKIKFQG